MSTPVEEPPKPTAASLLSDILGDLQILVEQQFQLTRGEIEEELRQRAAALSVLAFGLGVLFLDALVLCLALVHLLHWMASASGSEPAWLPLWACHAAVAVMLTAVGGILLQIGRNKLRSIEPCQNPVTEMLQEPVP